MDNVKKTYTDFHTLKASRHNYPTEWVIRTMLGTYPDLKIDKTKYSGGKILDIGFGDGRNMELLHNCGLNIYGVEIADQICTSVEEMMRLRNIKVSLKVGSNRNIPFESNYFDYVLASSSCYYVDGESSFNDNLIEINRVLKPGGFLIANFPLFSPDSSIEESFILKNCEFTKDGHIIIRNDIYGIRNGYRFKAFQNEDSLKNELSPFFDSICTGKLYENYYGIQINALLCVARKFDA